MMNARVFLAVCATCVVCVAAADEPPTSEYTSLAERKCVPLQQPDATAPVKMECGGYPPYAVIRETQIGRSWLNLRYHDRYVDLGAWTELFSESGRAKLHDSVEWRGVTRETDFVPYALVYRLTVSEPPAWAERIVSVIVCLDGEESKRIAYVGRDGTEEADARQAADLHCSSK